MLEKLTLDVGVYQVMQRLDTASRAKFAMCTKVLYNALLPTFSFEQYKSDYDNDLSILVALYWEDFNERRLRNSNLSLIKSFEEASAVYAAVTINGVSDLFSLILKVTALGTGMNAEAFKYVVNLLPDINERHNSGNSALHFAMIGGNVTYIKLLIKAHANTNMQNNKGDTPMHFSIVKDSLLLKILINANANPFIINNKGQSPLRLAEVHERYDCMQALLDYQEKLENQVMPTL